MQYNRHARSLDRGVGRLAPPRRSIATEDHHISPHSCNHQRLVHMLSRRKWVYAEAIREAIHTLRNDAWQLPPPAAIRIVRHRHFTSVVLFSIFVAADWRLHFILGTDAHSLFSAAQLAMVVPTCLVAAVIPYFVLLIQYSNMESIGPARRVASKYLNSELVILPLASLFTALLAGTSAIVAPKAALDSAWFMMAKYLLALSWLTAIVSLVHSIRFIVQSMHNLDFTRARAGQFAKFFGPPMLHCAPTWHTKLQCND
jgi:hypothetical protein